MFNKIHHIAIIGSDYNKSKEFYVKKLGFEIVRENYRSAKQDYKIDLKCGDSLWATIWVGGCFASWVCLGHL